MKNLLTLFIFSFFSTSLFTQFVVDWSTVMGGNAADRINGVAQTSDGCYLIYGYSFSSDIESHPQATSVSAYASKLSANGEILWEKAFGGSNAEVFFSFVEMSDGYLFSGYTGSNNGDVGLDNINTNTWLVKLDYDGSLIWEKTLDGPGLDFGYEIIKTNDDNYVVVGIGDSNGVRLTKFDADLEIEWDTTFNQMSNELATKVVQDSTGHFIICSLDTGVSVTRYTMYRVSPEGELLWRKEVGCADRNYLFPSLIALATDEYLIGGSCNQDGIVIKVDSEGNVIWRVLVGGLGEEAVFDLDIQADGSIIGSGFTSSDSLGLDIGLNNFLRFKLDSDGNQLWQEVIGTGYFSEGTAVTKTKDDGYLIAGLGDMTDITAIRLSPRSTATSLLNPTSTILLYPNPATNKIIMKIDSKNIGARYFIHNSIGQLCGTGLLRTTLSEINVSQLLSGKYNLIVIQNDKSDIHLEFLKL